MDTASPEAKRRTIERVFFELSRAFYSFRSAGMMAVLLMQAAAFFFAWSKGAGAIYSDMAGLLLLVTAVLWIYTSVVHGSRRILICCLLLLTVGTMLQCIFIAEKLPTGRGSALMIPGLSSLQLQYLIGLAGGTAAGAMYYRHKGTVSFKLCRGLFAGSLLLSLIALLYSGAVGGARNWIRIGFLSIQTTELIKPVYLLTAACLLGTGDRPSEKQLLYFRIITAIYTLMLALQGEFGTLLLILLVFLGLTVLFLPDKKQIFLTIIVFTALILLVAAGGFLLTRLQASGTLTHFPGPFRSGLSAFDKVRNRFVYWMHPEQDPQGLGYQLLRAREAIFLGGFFGTSSLTRLPVETSDLVYPALIERCGLVFALLVLILYVSMWLEGIRVSVRKEDRCHKVIAAGASYMLFYQTLIIIGGSTGLCPLTGITLPFISSGGSSLLVSFILAVLLITASGNIRWKGADYAHEEKKISAPGPAASKSDPAVRHLHADIHRADLGYSSRPVKRRRYEEKPGPGKSI